MLRRLPSCDSLIRDHADIQNLIWHPKTGRLLSINLKRGLVPDIAANIVWKRCPRSPQLIHEVALFGVLALFLAADRYDHSSKASFDTYARYWIDKYCRLYLDEIIGIVPRTGHMGPDPSCPGLDLPRRSVMDLLDHALAGNRQTRGKAAGGMAVFDAQLMLPGPNPDDKPIDVFSTEGPTREYLQRRVGVGGARFVWPKVVSREVMAPWIDESKARPTDAVEFTRGVRDFVNDHVSMEWRLHPAEVCYLHKQRPYRQFNSYDRLGEITYAASKIEEPKYRTPEWRNGLVFAVEYLKRNALRREKPDERTNQILRRTDAVQTPTGVSRRRGRHRPQAHDEPKRLLPASIAGEVGT